MVKKHVVVPTPVRMQAFEIVDGKLVHLHSNLWQYEDQDFVCEVGAPLKGGYVVWIDGRPTYFTDTNYNKKFELFSNYQNMDQLVHPPVVKSMGETTLGQLRQGSAPVAIK